MILLIDEPPELNGMIDKVIDFAVNESEHSAYCLKYLVHVKDKPDEPSVGVTKHL